MKSNIRFRFDKLLHDSGRAILVRVVNNEVWIPRKLCRNLIINNKLGGNVSIPEWLFEQKGISKNLIIPDETIVKHVPKPIEKKVTHDKSLFTTTDSSD